MNPNDLPGDPFKEQAIPGPVKAHVCEDGRCVIIYSGGRITDESKRSVEDFLRRHAADRGE